MPQARHRCRALVFVAIVTALFVAAQFLDIPAWVDPAREYLQELGPTGWVAFVVGYAVLTTFGVPGTPLTLAAGVLFGPLRAFALMVVATTLSSSLGFFIARRFGRRAVRGWLEGRPMYERFEHMVEQQGWVAIPLARVLPVFPFAFVNYAFGLTSVRFWTYLLASELVMIPMNGVWVGLADATYATVVAGEVPWVGLVLATGFGLALVGLVAAVKRGYEAVENS